MRITEPYDINYKHKNITVEETNRLYAQLEEKNYLAQLFWKLGKLEDIEDELGIDLITLFKALTKGFYIKTFLGIEKARLSDFKVNLIKKEIQRIVYFNHYYFKDYGKTWALTKEEL